MSRRTVTKIENVLDNGHGFGVLLTTFLLVMHALKKVLIARLISPVNDIYDEC